MSKESDDKLQTKALYSQEAEEAVLGCMLSQPDEVILEMVSFPLTEDDFFVPANKVIYRTLVKMHEEGDKIDVMLVHQQLDVDKVAQEVNSPGILAQLLVAFATHLNVRSYALIVRKKAVLRTLLNACSAIVQDATARPDAIAEVLDNAENTIFDTAQQQIVGSDESSFGIEIEEAMLGIMEHADAGGGLRGLPTGFKKLNDLTTGWNPGELIVVAARPGKGKTGLALAFIKTILENKFNVENGTHDIPGDAVQMFSLEMTRQDLYMRFYAMMAGVNLMDIMTGDLTENDRGKIAGAKEKMAYWKFFIDDTPRLDIDLIRSRTRRAKRKHNIAAMVLDYVQLAKSRKYPRDRQNEVAYISGTCKEIARENGIPVIILAQLNRNDATDEEKEPHIANIRDSGAIEQDADKIILLHELKNADRLKRATDSVKHYQAILAKHRNGRQGKVDMDFQAWRVFFTEVDKSWH